MPLLSTDTLRTDYLPGVSSGDTETIAVLGRALSRAEAAVARYLGYPGHVPTLASQSYTLRLAAREYDAEVLTVPVVPVTAIASVHQDLLRVFGADSAVSASDYEQENLRNGTLLRLLPSGNFSRWYTRERTIKVVCTAGYANEAAAPPELADAIYRWVADWYLRREIRHLRSVAASAGAINQGIADMEAIPPDIEQLISPYMLLGSVGAT